MKKTGYIWVVNKGREIRTHFAILDKNYTAINALCYYFSCFTQQKTNFVIRNNVQSSSQIGVLQKDTKSKGKTGFFRYMGISYAHRTKSIN